MIGALFLTLAPFTEGIQTDCTVMGESAPSFVYTIHDITGAATDVDLEPVGGSRLFDSKVAFTGTQLAILPGSSGERAITNFGSLKRGGVDFGFTALARIGSNNSLQPFELWLHIGPQTIKALCDNSRSPVGEGAAGQ